VPAGYPDPAAALARFRVEAAAYEQAVTAIGGIARLDLTAPAALKSAADVYRKHEGNLRLAGSWLSS
jgi:hypothetical protein